MPTYPFVQVDAFTDRPLGGNPCAVLFDTDGLDDATMQAIARENNLSETVFVRRSERADFGVRYFTPAQEIPMAGHPTIATAFALVDAGRLALAGDRTPLTLELAVGPIAVEILAEAGVVRSIVMTQPRPQLLTTYDTAEILPCFGLAKDDARSDAPAQVVSAGTPQLMVPLRELDALRRARVDAGVVERLHPRLEFLGAHLYCAQGVSAAGQTFARHLVLEPDPWEDPFTGSATGGMAAHMWHYGLIDTPRFVAEQGHWMSRPGRADVEILGPPDAIEGVRVGGGAVAVLRGEFSL